MAINFENRYTDVSANGRVASSDYLRTIVRGWRTIATVTLIALALGCVRFPGATNVPGGRAV